MIEILMDRDWSHLGLAELSREPSKFNFEYVCWVWRASSFVVQSIRKGLTTNHEIAKASSVPGPEEPSVLLFMD